MKTCDKIGKKLQNVSKSQNLLKYHENCLKKHKIFQIVVKSIQKLKIAQKDPKSDEITWKTTKTVEIIIKIVQIL